MVYKDYATTSEGTNEQIDRLRNIDILHLSEKNDVLDLRSNQPSLVIDFAEGHDVAKLSSSEKSPNIENHLGLEELQWTPLDANGNPLVTQPISFDVAEWHEDANNLITIGEYPPVPGSDSTEPGNQHLFPSRQPGDRSSQLAGTGRITCNARPRWRWSRGGEPCVC